LKLAKDTKIKAYLDWLLDNGAIFDKVEHPACYGEDGCLKGTRALEDIAPNEGFFFIPEKLFMSKQKAMKSPIG